MGLFDSEKGSSKNDDSTTSTLATATPPNERVEVEPWNPMNESIWTRLGVTAESFKPAPGHTTDSNLEGRGEPTKAIEGSQLQAKMSKRHLGMIALGGSIGTGLFVGSGQALRQGGPLGVLIAWSIVGVLLINVTQALGEMCIMFPVSGGFYTLAVRFLDPGFGMAMGWNYFAQWVIVLPLEITAAGITVQYWERAAAVPIAVWITVFWLAIILLNVFGTLGYAEEEFWSCSLKLITAIIFIIIGIVLNCGGGKNEYSEYIGGRYWHDPGSLANGFHGICAVFVTAAFSFAGTELVGIAATETKNPRAYLPTAIKGTFWRISLIYLSTLVIIGLNLPYNDPRLLGGGVGAGTSPFVIVALRAGLNGFDHFINVVICISVLSIGTAAVYAGSRVLTALSETGYAPRCFKYVDKSGRPLYSVIAVLLAAPIAYVNCGSSGTTVFNWLQALSGLSTLFSWAAICLSHIRFRAAWKHNGHSVDELPFRALGGVWGSWMGLFLIALVLIAQFYVALFPIGGPPDDPQKRAEDFFLVYLALPVLLFFWAGAIIKKRTRPWKISEIDIDTGRKCWDTAEELNLWRAERRKAPLYVRIYRMLFSY
ncbi:hypothetical protein JCM3765_005055 [Sporobolomyces pararoseus]